MDWFQMLKDIDKCKLYKVKRVPSKRDGKRLDQGNFSYKSSQRANKRGCALHT